jgi:hypothetical protein
MIDNPNFLATFPNTEYGIVSTVTKVSKGYAVTLIDSESEMIVGCKVFPLDRLTEAINYAEKVANVIP